MRLGSAEQLAQQASAELRASEGAQDALMSEIETVSQTYEEVQAKNDELRQTLSLKEEALTRAKSEKMRADHTAAMLRAENAQLAEHVDALSTQGEATAALRASFEGQLKKATMVAQKRDEEVPRHATPRPDPTRTR